MRLREIPLFLIAPLGLAAALVAHVTLQAFAAFDLGAPEYALHAHAAIGPAIVVESVLALWSLAVAVRGALTSGAQSWYAPALRPQLGPDRFSVSAALVAFIATATLFGMEVSESGSVALGLGWLGGALLPGVLALAIAITFAVGTLYLTLAGQLAGFDRLVALLAAALARCIATLLAPAPVLQRLPARRITARPAPVARHAALRAPPTASL